MLHVQVYLPKVQGGVRVSQWSAKTLSASQIEYAALDAVLGYQIYSTANGRGDVSLSEETAVAGTQVQLVLGSGAVCALGVICDTPTWGKKKARVPSKCRVVKITEVLVCGAMTQYPGNAGEPKCAIKTFSHVLGTDESRVLWRIVKLRRHVA